MMNNNKIKRNQKLATYNPNDVSLNDNGLFGFPFDYNESELIIIGVPWDATTSYKPGTAGAPRSILKASKQLDSYTMYAKNEWKRGIYLCLDDTTSIENTNKIARDLALNVIQAAETGKEISDAIQIDLNKTNQYCEMMNDWVYKKTKKIINDNKYVALLGGDHSTPLGLYKALLEKHNSFGILQIDAHCDLRKCYEGFTYSHASVMYNALPLQGIETLVQVGIRDYCEAEIDTANSSKKVQIFYDENVKNELYQGVTWHEQCEKIVAALPNKVHVSFDIDGLSPHLCNGTGTPVAGGFELSHIHYLLHRIRANHKQIISFDLVEVNETAEEDEYNSNVGARALMMLSNFLFLTNKEIDI